MKTGRLFSGSGLIALLLLLVAHAASAQDSRGSTGAVSLLNRVSAAVAGANAVEYISTVRSIDRTGQSVTLYVHAKIRKPLNLYVTVSPKAIDAADAVVIVSDGTTITGFDPKLGLVTHHAVDFSGPSLALPPGFEMVGAAFPTVRQVFGSAPFDALFYGTAHAPMTLVRHGVDVPGTLLIDARWPTELVGQERIARLYVDITATTPRRLLLGSAADGHDSLQYVEDFGVFTLNPSFPDDTFHWTPPASLSLPPAPLPSHLAKPAAKKAVKHPHTN